MSAPAAVPPLDMLEGQSLSAATLENGSFAIATRRALGSPTGAGFEFVAEFFAPDGSQRGAPVVLAWSQYRIEGGIGSLGDHYFVTWQLFDASGSAERAETVAALYSQDGEVLHPAFSWPNSEIGEASYHSFYRYAAEPRWPFLPVLFQQSEVAGPQGPTHQFIVRVRGQDLAPLGRAPTLDSPRHVAIIEDAAVNGDGRYVLAIQECPRNPLSSKPCIRGVQIFGASGRPQSPRITEGLAAAQGELRVGMTPEGQVLVATLLPGAGGSELLARLYDRHGAPLSPEVRGAGNYPHGHLREIRGLANGNFLLAFDATGDGLAHSLFLAEFRTKAQQLLEPVLVTNDFSSGYAFALNISGQGVIAWDSRNSAERIGRMRLMTILDDLWPARKGLACLQHCDANQCDQSYVWTAPPNSSGWCQNGGGALEWDSNPSGYGDVTFAEFCLTWEQPLSACTPSIPADGPWPDPQIPNLSAMSSALGVNPYVATLIYSWQADRQHYLWAEGPAAGLFGDAFYNESVLGVTSPALPVVGEVIPDGARVAQIDITVLGDTRPYLRQYCALHAPTAVPPWTIHGSVTEGGLHGSLLVVGWDGKSQTIEW